MFIKDLLGVVVVLYLEGMIVYKDVLFVYEDGIKVLDYINLKI